MIFSRVSPLKGKRFFVPAMVLPLLMVLIVGVAAFVVPSEAAAPESVAAPAMVSVAGESRIYESASGKGLNLRQCEVTVNKDLLTGGALDLPETPVSFGLFDGFALTGVVEKAGPAAAGVLQCSGRLLEKDHGYFTISIDSSERALIQIDVLEENMAYVVAEDPAAGKYFATELPLNEVRDAAPFVPVPTPVVGTVVEGGMGEEVSGPVSIDLLVAYTPEAEAWADANRSGILNVIAQSLDKANQTFAASSVDLSLRLVLAAPTAYTESGNALTDLHRATFSSEFDPDGLDPEDALSDLHELRDAYGADLVVLMNASDTGAAWLLKNAAGDARYGFSVVPVQDADVSLIRQVGFNLGCNGSRNQADNPASAEGGLYPFSTGLRWVGSDGRGYASIMASPGEDIQVFLFSNPDISFAGVPAGVSDVSDNARSLRAVMRSAALYQEEKASAYEGEQQGEGADEGETLDSTEGSDADISTTAGEKQDKADDSVLFIQGGTDSYSGADPWGTGRIFSDVRSLAKTDIPTNNWKSRSLNTDVGFIMGHEIVAYKNAAWLIGGTSARAAGPFDTSAVYYSENGYDWTVKTTASAWGPRRGHTALTFGGKMWVLGGGRTGTTEHYNDVWSSTTGTVWTRESDSGTGAGWSARAYHSSAVFNSRVYVLGGGTKGEDNIVTRYNDVWYSTNGKTWTQEDARERWAPRFGHTSVVFEVTPGVKTMWVMGGQIADDQNSESSYANDVWSTADGINWIKVTGSAPWPVRRDHVSVVYDGKIWVIGGWNRDSGAVVELKDAWYTTDGANWVEALPPATWLGRHDFSAIVFPAEDGTGEGEGEGTVEGEVVTEGEGATDVPTADFNAESKVRDKNALLPLHDWVPLFRFSMAYDPENFAPRYLKRLAFRLVNDPAGDDRGLEYQVTRDLDVSDLLELGIFEDRCSGCGCEGDEGGEPRLGNLDSQDDLLFSWDSRGYDRGRLITEDPVDGSDLLYDIVFDYDDSYYRLAAGATSDNCEGRAFIVAVRTSATWRSQLSMGAEVLLAEMVDPLTGLIPRDEEGAVTDSYSPDFFNADGAETLDAEAFYSSSFGTYDPSGPDFRAMAGLSGFANAPIPNFWNHTPHLSIPLAEFSRPRWNKPLQLMSIASGQFMEIRKMLSLDDWTAVVGINLHSTKSYGGGYNDEGKVPLRELNLVLTDIGADPLGSPGNGGFNPSNALKPIILARNDGDTVGHHIIHNGAWVWADMNRNNIFDPPTPQAGGGATYNGDRPLAPYELEYNWEYVPEPPGGGDPWWKVRLRFSAGTDAPEAYAEPVPNNAFPIDDDALKLGSEISYDYFVVTRFDSGFRDCSLRPATNTGATYGADFRAFVEPRRYDTVTASWTGGIYVDSQIPLFDVGPPVGSWQDDPRWFDEPWWPERTLNEQAAKPFRLGVEVHDLVHTYSPQYDYFKEFSFFNLYPDFLVSQSLFFTRVNLGHVPIGNMIPTMLGAWLDPLGLGMSRFQNGHYPDIYTFQPIEFSTSTFLFGNVMSLLTDAWPYPQYAFETRPFYNEDTDRPPTGPRSPAYPVPPAAPIIPDYTTWPGGLAPGQYPRLSDWNPADAQARLLTQKISSESAHTAMLGINLTGSVDPVVNGDGNSVTLAEMYIAFWGPDFTPDILNSLDPDKNRNQSLESGILLWDNAPTAPTSIFMPRVFFNTEELENYGDTPLPLFHRIIPLTGLKWGGAPELIDLSGDGYADDLDGDGFVDDRDKAWVLKLLPSTQWQLPLNDIVGTQTGGLDLFVSVKTSEHISRFQKFRAVVPATLPSRSESLRKAGIQFYPTVNTSSTSYIKAQGDEGPVQEYYGHDMIEANVPLRIVDMTQRWSDMHIGGGAVPVIGLDISTNREDGVRANGSSGTGDDKTFRVDGAVWASNAFIGDYLVDSRYESYEITGNSTNTLTLRSGSPRDGAWHIVQEPTFLEEVTVELYQEGTVATFNPLTDLLPLDFDQRISGVAIYRDNDNHPENRNGIFDPDVDIPLVLDGPPRFIGRSAEDTKVRFVFSLPGTRDFPRPVAEQPRNRQWVYDSFGVNVGDPENGADFIVVLRASQSMQVGDNLRAGIVSWGPNTPTQPDPHIWVNLPGEERNDYMKFYEYPWAERGVGFVTVFKEPQTLYFLNGDHGVQRPDSSGYNWIRTHSSEKRRSGVITARNRPLGPLSLEITSVSQSVLPVQTLPGTGFSFVIYGKNFGATPMVALSGYDVTVNSATDTSISVTIATRAGVVPEEPITLVVRNPITGDEVSRSDLFTLTSTINVNGPKIHSLTPSSARQNDFPIVITGENFFDAGRLQVRFGETLMPILDVSPDGRTITVGFPMGGMPQPGLLDVLVASTGLNNGQDIKVNGFEYINPEQREKVRFFGCGPADGASGGAGGDLLLVVSLIALLAIAGRRRIVEL